MDYMHPGFFTTYEETKSWLDEVEIENYEIDETTLVVDVKGNVKLENVFSKYIPIQFGYVSGWFALKGSRLYSLVGCPETVGGDFYCVRNFITDLIGGPKNVDGNYTCFSCDLHTLEGIPDIVNGLNCKYNRKLTSFKDGPSDIRGSLNFSHTGINSFDGDLNFNGYDIKCVGVNMYTLAGVPRCSHIDFSDNLVTDITPLVDAGIQSYDGSGNMLLNSEKYNITDDENYIRYMVTKLTGSKEYMEQVLDSIKTRDVALYDQLVGKYNIRGAVARSIGANVYRKRGRN